MRIVQQGQHGPDVLLRHTKEVVDIHRVRGDGLRPGRWFLPDASHATGREHLTGGRTGQGEALRVISGQPLRQPLRQRPGANLRSGRPSPDRPAPPGLTLQAFDRARYLWRRLRPTPGRGRCLQRRNIPRRLPPLRVPSSRQHSPGHP